MSQNDRSSEEDRKRRLSNKSVIKMNGDNTATISQPGAGAGAGAGQGEEDTWHSTAALFQDHVEEIHGKWDSIEDDIWGKVSFATSAT